jgi:biotin carboxyl carrier protein
MSNDQIANTEVEGVRETITIEQLQRLVRLMDQSDVSEIEVKQAASGLRLALRKAKEANGQLPEGYIQLEPEVSEEETPSSVESKHTIVAPLVGIFHSWAKPRGAPLVSVGDQVKVGQVVGTIQSLNVINEVETTVAGRVVELFVQSGQPVEYGQPLMALEDVEEA